MSSTLLLLLLSLLSLFLNVSLADNHTAVVITNSNTTSPLPPPLHNLTSSFMPGIAVVIAVLTAFFSLTFLLLLYVKHCKRRNDGVYSNHQQRFAVSRYGGGYYAGGVVLGRKNSGIDRSVIESLPVFRFGALSGQKDGLECAVCLARFEPTEVLRLLPKCKHAFHVECVDTWLDAHSTCPLCRYRVDPEDILLISDCNSWFELRFSTNRQQEESNSTGLTRFIPVISRISGRHSSAGERASRRLNEIRASSASSKTNPAQFRRSLDSSLKVNNSGEEKSETVAVNCLDRLQRKDGLLLVPNRESFEGRFEHRIIISGGNRDDQRWSEVRPSDLLYLRSEMILSECKKLATAEGGRDVINGRSVSELTSIERRRRWGGEPRQRQATAVISRWLAWSHRASASSVV
ncbi:PREDICTED: RING-H2 finger protein ATL43-like [Camelina sativa]|uniref:RING-type E3 ubiquitin transferase n=1 Tax=Camelina sativa TaxID=90675 RepID=A0ABM0TAS6_CAMSA|nr:PREDICTED: RING-H2 finger protein ATL43-like [Camelina sativa]